MLLESESALRELVRIRKIMARARRSRAKGGWHLIGVGLLFGLASLYHWALQNSLLPFPKGSLPYVWAAAALLTIPLSLVLNSKSPRGTTADYVYRAARLSVLAVVISLWLLICIASWRFQNGDIMEMIGPTAAILNGGFWLVFASVQERRPLLWVPVLSFVVAIALAFLLRSKHFYLATAIMFFVLFVVPGIYLRRPIPPSDAEEG
jgi:hypothetical protein